MPRFENHECLLLTEEEDVVKQFIDSGILIGFRRRFRRLCMIDRKHPTTQKFFKSNAACRNEEIKHLLNHYYMIHPFGLLNLYWEFCYFCLFMLHYTAIPVTSSLAVTGRISIPGFARYGLVLACLNMADIMKLFFTGYYDRESSKVVLNFSKVARRYLRTYFIFDGLSCVHIFTFMSYLINPDTPTSITFPVRLLNRLKITRLPRCLDNMDLFREYMGYSSYLFKGLKVIYVFLVVIFWAFSINFFVETCLKLYSGKREFGNLENKIFERYYDATLLLLMVSYVKYNLTELLEYLNAVFFLFFGYALQLFVYAQILQVWTKYASAENKHHSLHKQFEEYMKYKELPLSLRERIFAYFHFKFQKHFFKESDINNLVSPLLKQEIMLHVTRNHIERVEFFKYLPENILIRVVSQLKSEVFLPGDVIISAGTEGSTMFFIYHGTVAVYTPTGKEICHLEDGAHFGEIALILSQTRVATVVAVTTSELFMLRRSDFLATIEPFPEFKDQLVALAAERLHKAILETEE